MMRVTLYSRPECHLCDQARADLETLRAEIPHRLVEVDIESDPALLKRYHDQIPVLKVGPYTLKAPFSATDLRVTLMAARDGHASTPASGKSRARALRLNRAVLFFSRHWLAVFNLLVFLYVGLPFAAPVLMKAGLARPARWIYTAYSPLCHQLAFRSWFLFGEQAAYPKELAGTSLDPYGQATGQDEGDFWAARAFLGNERVGYKVALCERDVAIYGGILTAGLMFSLVRGRLRPLPLWAWFLLGIVPIAVDGTTQLIGGLRLSVLALPARESTPFLRTLTGALFGVMNVWLAYPYVEETMAETRALVSVKLSAAEQDSRPIPSGD